MNLENCDYTKVNTRTEKESNEDDNPSTKEANVSYFELYKFATPFDKLLIAIGVITSVVAGGAAASSYYVTGVAVDAIVQFGYDLNKNPNAILEAEEKLMLSVHRFIVYTIAMVTIGLVNTYLSTFLFNYTALNQVFRIRELYFSSLLNQDISWHDQNKTGDFASRNTDDLKKLQDSIGEKASMFIYTSVLILSGVALALFLGWELSLISSIPFPIIFGITWYIGNVSSNFSKKESDLFGEASIVAEEALTGIKTVVAFEGQQAEKKRYTALLKSALVNNIKRYRYIGFNNAIAISFSFFCSALTFWYGIKLVLKDRESSLNGYNTQVVVSILIALTTSYYYIGTLLPLLEVLTTGIATASNIFHVISTQPSINKCYEKGRKLKDLQGNITFAKVSFSYPSRKVTKVLQELSFSINSGQTVALVGSSGCGKSTCIQLLQRFYDPDTGNILVDDVALSELDLTWWRSQIGVVNQEPVLFEATIAQNIRLGLLDATQKDVEDAARKANAHEFVTGFPEGYETVIGEGGAQLSGGQKQRIAIARALIRKPTILLLDEATSALDSESEALVQTALDSACKDCTTIVVAHRLSTIMNADKIIFIGEGTAVEEGTHEELLASKSFYGQLVRTQTEKQEVLNLDISQKLTKRQSSKAHVFTENIETTEIKEELKLRESYSIFRELIKLNLSEKWIIIMGCLFAISEGTIYSIWGLIFGNTVGIISEVDSDKARQLSNVNALIFLILGIVTAILSFFHVYLIAVAGEKLVFKLRSLMFSSILGQEISWFDKSENGVGALGARLSGDIANIQGALGQKTSTILICIPNLAMIFIMGVILDYRLLLINIAFSPILFVSVYFEYKLLEKESQLHSDMLVKSTKLGVEVLNNIRTVASLSIENVALKLYMGTLTLYGRVAQQNTHLRGIVYGIAKNAFGINYCVSIYFGALLMKHGYVDGTSVIILTQIIVTGILYVAGGLAYSPNFTSGLTSFGRVLEVINRRPLIQNSNKETDQAAGGDIEYKQIEFSYPTRPDAKVLENFNLSVMKGQTIALVGPSGCGKSTVIQLLERFYDATDGHITFGKVNISETNLFAHRMRLAVVSQEPNLFSRTIFQNIAYGDNSKEIPRDEVIKAAEKANIHNFISSLPLGYDTELGEKGTQLSGGQKQRIAIARALVRNPEVLLLDEATSALDAENERIVQQALDNAKEGRTCIMIAHNLKTIENADIIVVISDGTVDEMGTHAELISKGGLYEKLYNARH